MSQRVLVTGATGEIGSAIARCLSDAGFAVDFTYCRSEQKAAQLRDRLDHAARGGLARRCDLADLDAVAGLAQDLEPRDYHGVVHAAGMTCDSLVPTLAIDQAQQTMAVNFWAYALLCRAFSRGMARRGAGRFVAISSVTAARGSRGNAVYSASKAALEAFNRAFAVEYGGRGITANAVAPGFVNTRMIQHLPDLEAQVRDAVPARRFGEPEETAQAVLFLLSASAGYVNGAVLPVDGGLGIAMGVRR